MAKRSVLLQSTKAPKRAKLEPEGVFAGAPSDVLEEWVRCDPGLLPDLVLVSKWYCEVLSRPIAAIWRAYFDYYASAHYGYTEYAPGKGETWRDLVLALPTLEPRPFVLFGQPQLNCGFVMPQGGAWGLWFRPCPTCGQSLHRGHRVVDYFPVREELRFCAPNQVDKTINLHFFKFNVHVGAIWNRAGPTYYLFDRMENTIICAQARNSETHEYIQRTAACLEPVDTDTSMAKFIGVF
jgi:hypothetical protein